MAAQALRDLISSDMQEAFEPLWPFFVATVLGWHQRHDHSIPALTVMVDVYGGLIPGRLDYMADDVLQSFFREDLSTLIKFATDHGALKVAYMDENPTEALAQYISVYLESNAKLIAIPVQHAAHWILLEVRVIFAQKKVTMTIWDPLLGDSGEAEWAESLFDPALRLAVAAHDNLHEYNVVTRIRQIGPGRQQQNLEDCGLFVFRYMLEVTGLTKALPDLDGKQLRLETCLMLAHRCKKAIQSAPLSDFFNDTAPPGKPLQPVTSEQI